VKHNSPVCANLINDLLQSEINLIFNPEFHNLQKIFYHAAMLLYKEDQEDIDDRV
jgi:hypothetical protein